MGLFIGAALGPWLGRLIFDTTGRYLWALMLAMGVIIVVLTIDFCVPSTRREIREKIKAPLKERLKTLKD